MKTRLLLVSAVASIAIGFTSLPVFAEPETTASEIENSKFTFAGEVNADGTLIRSGPSESDYAAMKLDKGAKITVVGMRFDWLKVTPPEGSFCLVPQAYIERSGDGSIGKVGQNPATVRIGSSLTQQKHKVPMRLDPGTSVKILGSVDEFYKIEPPTGVYLFVDKKFVNPIKRLDENGNPKPEVTTNSEATTNTPNDTASTESQPADTSTTSNESTSTDPHGRFIATSDGNNAQIPPGTTEQPTEDNPTAITESAMNDSMNSPSETTSDSAAPTFGEDSQMATNVNEAPTNETVATASRLKVSGEPTRVLIERLQRLEDQYTEASKWPIGEQPVEQMLADYQVLAAEPNLPPASKQVAEFRVQSLLIRKDALDSYRDTQKAIADATAKRQNLAAEQAELEQRVADTQVTMYTALGRLAVSSLQAGSETLYRLVDPANGRLVIYIRTNDPTILANLDQFVGITGEIVDDPTLKLTYIRPANLELVDPNMVNNRVFAQYTPNSFLIMPMAGDGGLEN